MLPYLLLKARSRYYRYRRPGNRPISRKGIETLGSGAPVLYDVVVASPADTVTERIGFRTLRSRRNKNLSQRQTGVYA